MTNTIPARSTQKDAAIDALSAIVASVDPLYRPAEFLLGYMYLNRGDAKNAECVFTRLVERFDDQQRQAELKVREQWGGIAMDRDRQKTTIRT
jgi:hypothetical protein